MKLLTFRRWGDQTTRIGAISIDGEVIDLTSSYAYYLSEKGEQNSFAMALTQLPQSGHKMLQFQCVINFSVPTSPLGIDHVFLGLII